MIQLVVLTPDEILFNKEVTSFNVKQANESFSILKGHAPLIHVIKKTVISIKSANGNEFIAVSSGNLKVIDDEASFLVDYGVKGSSAKEVIEKLKTHEEKLKELTGPIEDSALAQLEMEILKRAAELGIQ